MYELYLEALIESWNLARSLDLHSVGPRMSYLDTVQVLAPLALWLRETNPSAGLVTRADLENWLVGYYRREWALPPGEARQRGRELLEDVQSYSNLLLERGEGQYGFLHLTLEEMLAAKGVAQVADEDGVEKAGQLMTDHLADPAWRETLLLAVGAVGVIQQRPAAAGKLLMMLLESEAGDVPRGANVVLAGEALLDVGETGVQRPVAGRVTRALVEIMRSPDCHIRERRDAGVVLGRLGWRPEPEEGDLILTLDDPSEPSGGLDAFRRVGQVWMGKYSVTNGQYARFVRAGGYDDQHWWTEEGWAWRTGRYASRAPKELQDWLKGRPSERRNLPFWWRDRRWNSPLQPVVGVTWFESLAYCAWLGAIWHDAETRRIASLPSQGLLDNSDPERLAVETRYIVSLPPQEWTVRLPAEVEWEEAMGGRGEYPWGDEFDTTRLNCADAWAGQDLSDSNDWVTWANSDESQDAGTTAVTTFSRGQSSAGVWDGSGNVWEWMAGPYRPGGSEIALRGGSWTFDQRYARVSYRVNDVPVDFYSIIGFRVVVAPI